MCKIIVKEKQDVSSVSAYWNEFEKLGSYHASFGLFHRILFW